MRLRGLASAGEPLFLVSVVVVTEQIMPGSFYIFFILEECKLRPTLQNMVLKTVEVICTAIRVPKVGQ